MLNNISPLTKPKKNSETHTKGQKDSFGIHAYGNSLTSFLDTSIFDSTGSITMNSSIPTCIQKIISLHAYKIWLTFSNWAIDIIKIPPTNVG